MKRTKTINQPDYTYYICELFIKGPNGLFYWSDARINEGFECKEDAVTRMKEQQEEGHTDGLTFKVYSGKYLKSKDIDVNDDSKWANPSYIKL